MISRICKHNVKYIQTFNWKDDNVYVSLDGEIET